MRVMITEWSDRTNTMLGKQFLDSSILQNADVLPKLAQTIARMAEDYRRELSIEWLGYEIPQWQERCPIRVEIGMHAGGETSFAFVGGGENSKQYNMAR